MTQNTDPVAELLLDPLKLVETVFTVPTKAGTTVPFTLLPIQRDRANRQAKRILGLKGRQMGYSSIGLALRAAKGMTIPDRNTLFITHDEESTALFRARIRHHYQDMQRAGLAPHIKLDNEKEMYFDVLNSRFLFETAGGIGVGRSFTVHDLHGSEVAHWPDASKLLAGALQSAPDSADIELESTPNGAAGAFYEIADATISKREALRGMWDLCFYEWWKDPGYTLGDVPPITNLTRHEEFLRREHKLTYGQIAWRRMKEAELSLLDTPFEQEYPEDPITCFISGAGKVFSLDKIRWLMEGVRSPVEEIPVPYGWGTIKYYEKPRAGHHYTVSLDPSEGSRRGDYTAIQVIDNREMTQAACVQARIDPNDGARLACRLGVEYNEAFLIIEGNGIGYSAVKVATEELAYPNLFYREDFDNQTQQQTYHPGWQTNVKTRPVLIADLIESINSGSCRVYDQETVKELVNLKWEDTKSRGRMRRAEAPEGGHDDLAMAWGLCIQGREYAPIPNRPQPVEEDWNFGSGRRITYVA